MDKLTSPVVIDRILKTHDLHFNKRFGQNFLIDENTVERIVGAGGITSQDAVLEVGPGIGTMTRALAARVKKVVCVEIDKKLIPVLQETLGDLTNVEIVCGDVLKTEVGTYFDGPFKIVSNLPYYVTTPIIMGFLESELPITGMTFLIQKEVGERLCATPGTKAYGSLTIAANFYADTAIDFPVPASVFMPRPKVDSIVVSLTPRPPQVQVEDKETFFKLVRAGFANRRKTLINSLTANSEYAKETLLAALACAGIEPGIRGEKLTGEDFARLANALGKDRR